jgi:hypothetical protein
MDFKKVFVEVVAQHLPDGSVRPLSIGFEDETYEVDRLKTICRAASTKVGGCGIRYTIVIKGTETYLYEDEGKWFVEAKARGG